MDELHIGEIGEYFINEDGFDFMSNQNMLEYDFIIIDTKTMASELKDSRPDDVERRVKDLKEFIAVKNLPIVFICSTPKFFHLNFALHGHHPFSSLFEIEIDEVKAEGRKIEINKENISSAFFGKYFQNFAYSACFSKHPGSSIGNAKSKKAMSVGFYTKDIVLLPDFDEDADFEQDEFLSDLYKFCKQVRRDEEGLGLPEWTATYNLPGEKQERELLVKIDDEITNLIKKREETELRLSSFLPLKQLWTSTGSTLENTVRMVFVELGFKVLNTEANRDDLLLDWKDQKIVVEIKGQTKSAAEKHAAQLEKWVSNHFAENEILPKGILIVNTYRELPLSERNLPSFPEQMLPYATSRNHCLTTSLQLCGLLLFCRENPEMKDQVIEEFISTVGLYKKFDDWKNWVTVANRKNLEKRNIKNN